MLELYCSYNNNNVTQSVKSLYIITLFLQSGDSVEKVIDENDCNSPYIIQVGPTTARQYFLVAERNIFTEVTSFIQAVAAMMALYYVFDIVYPNEWKSCLYFIEKNFFGIKGGFKFSPIQLGIISDIENIM